MKSRFHYEVHMAGRKVARFWEAENLFIEKEVPEKAGHIILKNGCGDSTFASWMEEIRSGRILKRRIEVLLWYEEEDLIARWALISACPLVYDARQQEIEVLKLEYRSIEKRVENADMEFHSRWYAMEP